MSRSQKIFTGIISFLPLLIFISYMISMIGFFSDFLYRAHEYRDSTFPEDIIFPHIFGIVIFAVIMGIVSLGVLVYFILLAVNNKKLDSTERLIWILIFLFAGMVGFPIYWYMKVWKDSGGSPNNQ